MRIYILFGTKTEIQELNLHEVISKLGVGIMLMTNDLNDQFVQDIYDIGRLGGEVANVLIVSDDPRITLSSLDRLRTTFPLIQNVFDAQSLTRPVRPFNMPTRFAVEPGGRGADKRPITLKAWEERAMAEFRHLEFQARWDETTRQLIEDEAAGLAFSIGYKGRFRDGDKVGYFEIEGKPDISLTRLGAPALDMEAIQSSIDAFAYHNPRLFGRTTVPMTAVMEEDQRAYLDMVRSLSWPSITVKYKSDNFEVPKVLPGDFILDEKFAAQFERDDPLTTGLKTISDELRRQRAPMPIGDAANYTTARPTWDKATKAQILADLESVKKTLDTE